MDWKRLLVLILIGVTFGIASASSVRTEKVATLDAEENQTTDLSELTKKVTRSGDFLEKNEINLPMIFDQKGITVIGSKKQAKSMPGSATFLNTKDIQDQAQGNVHELLRKVPGVYVRDEEGFGLFTNISLRGVDPGRSQKVTIMEDGILAAPAPYSAPAAYYTPNAGRMTGIEVLKGSSQIKYGPHTTGGVINYLSTAIPEEATYRMNAPLWTGSLLPIHGVIGNTVRTSAGNFGYAAELYSQTGAGFKTIDTTADFTNGSDTGFVRNEPMLKLSFEPNTANYQRFEAKIGTTTMRANETYLGLTDADFASTPYRRYAGSRFDNIDANHTRSYVRHLWEAAPDTKLTTTLYSNRFHRDWFKLNVDGRDLLNAKIGVLKGQAAGTLSYRHNNRDYYSNGAQTTLTRDFSIAQGKHELDLGVRFNADQERRLQQNVTYTQNASGVITGTANGAIGSGGNRNQESSAWAISLADKIQTDRWEITPGIRYETIAYRYTDFNTSGTPEAVTGLGSSQLGVIAPGIGAQYKLSNALAFFGGIHRGYSVPGPVGSASQNLKEETSLGSEVGLRVATPQGFRADITLFNTDFQNLIVENNIGGGGSGVTQNAGNIRSRGLEFAAEVDAGKIFERGFKNPYSLSFTYSDARLVGNANSTVSSDDTTIFSGGFDGARVPYVPVLQAAFGTGIETDLIGIHTDIEYSGETFTTASNTTAQVRPDGTPDANYGMTDPRTVMNLSGFYKFAPVKLFAKVNNLFDAKYIVARHPIGPRPGQPRTVMLGVGLDI